MDIQKGTYTYTGSGGQKCHVPIERVYSFSQLRKGDHIAIRRFDGLYFHHALVEVVREGIIIVIEYSNYTEEILQDIFDHRSPVMAKVMRGNYRWENGLYLIKHPDHTCLPAASVVARAQSRLGESRYHLFDLNCEHFVLWCKTGISSSEQVENIKKTVKKTAKENGPPLVVGCVAENGEEIVRAVHAGLNGTEKEVLRHSFHYLPKGAQDMLLNGDPTVAMQAFTQYLANGGQYMLQNGAQIASKQFFVPSLSKCGQAMMLNGGEISSLERLLSQSMSKGGQEVLKKVGQMAGEKVATQTVSKGGQAIMKESARKVVTRMSTTTGTSAGGSLIGGAAFGALVEGSIGLYDIRRAKKDRKKGNISQEEYNNFKNKRLVSGVSSVTGATAGAVVGQVLIPVPVVGGIVGSVIGGMVGRFSGGKLWDVAK